MVKTIRFDLRIDGVTVATLDDLRDHFTTEIIKHFRSGLLARWLRSRSMARELAAVEVLPSDDDAAVLKELCRIFKVEADDDAIGADGARGALLQSPSACPPPESEGGGAARTGKAGSHPGRRVTQPCRCEPLLWERAHGHVEPGVQHGPAFPS